MIDAPLEYPEAAPEPLLRSLARKTYVPAPPSGTKTPFFVLTPVFQSTNEAPGLKIWTSNTNPFGAASAAQVTVNVVEVVPDFGAALIGTLTVPVEEFAASW